MKALVPGHTAREEQSWGLTPELDPQPCRSQMLGDPRGHWLPSLGTDPLRGSFSAGSGRVSWVGTESRNTGPLPTPHIDVWSSLLLAAGDGSACVSVSVYFAISVFLPLSLYLSLCISFPLSLHFFMSLCLYLSLPQFLCVYICLYPSLFKKILLG